MLILIQQNINLRKLMKITFFLCCLFLVENVLSKTFPKILWIYWHNDYSSDRLLIMFEQNHRRIAQGWDLRIVTDENAEQYLKPIPYYKGDFFQMAIWPFGTTAHRSDYLRILVLSYYGGVYIDWATILLNDMSWLQFEALKANPDVENKYGDQPDVLLFTYPYYGSQKTANINNQTYKLSPGYEIWFIAAKANTTFMQQYLKKYWEGRQDGMLTDSTKFDQISINEKIQIKALYKSSYSAAMTLIQIWFQRMQKQFDKESELKGEPRKLVPWHYKVWHINSERGPYSCLFATWSLPVPGQAQFFPKMSYQQMTTYLKCHPKYFIKMPNSDRVVLSAYITQFSQVNIFNFILMLHRTRWLIIQKFFCPQKYQIYEPSLFNQYMIKYSSKKDTIKLVNEHYKISDVEEKCRVKMKFVKICAITGIVIVVTAAVAAVLFCGFKIYKRRKPRQMELVNSQQNVEMEDASQNQKFTQ